MMDHDEVENEEMEELVVDDAALIDAFDVEPETTAVPPLNKTRAQAQPILRPTSAAPAMPLRHYPSFHTLATTNATPSPASQPQRSASVRYPAVQSVAYPSLASLVTTTTPQPSSTVHDESTNLHKPPPSPADVTDHQAYQENKATCKTVQPTALASTTDPYHTIERIVATQAAIDAEALADAEYEAQHQALEAELAKFQQQNAYLGLALAGETPHQIEMRRQREQERNGREERRVVAMEARLEHMIQREHEREERMDERRQRCMERAHRSSTEPSPEREEHTASVNQ